jgi:hypothetical protein
MQYETMFGILYLLGDPAAALEDLLPDVQVAARKCRGADQFFSDPPTAFISARAKASMSARPAMKVLYLPEPA